MIFFFLFKDHRQGICNFYDPTAGTHFLLGISPLAERQLWRADLVHVVSLCGDVMTVTIGLLKETETFELVEEDIRPGGE